ncbi:uncharacterized protein LOC141857961 [Brevipalpus obovatus]|uniref:uncharacterized protein LOC141857961 n=1 Tax=Brevipalpus obovatus TaxID=246614 RepID=UPI003D9E620C
MTTVKASILAAFLFITFFGIVLSNWGGWNGWGYSHTWSEPWGINHGYKWGNKKAHVKFDRHGHPAWCTGWGWNEKCHGGDDWVKYSVHQQHDGWGKKHGWGWN